VETRETILLEIKANVLAPSGTDVPHPIADFLPCVAERIDVSMNIGTLRKYRNATPLARF
jgi:hypothetical protein